MGILLYGMVTVGRVDARQEVGQTKKINYIPVQGLLLIVQVCMRVDRMLLLKCSVARGW